MMNFRFQSSEFRLPIAFTVALIASATLVAQVQISD